MKEDQAKKPTNKIVVAISVFLFSWPLLLLIISLQSIYSIAGSSVDNASASTTIDAAEFGVRTALYGGFVSYVLAFILLAKKLRT